MLFHQSCHGNLILWCSLNALTTATSQFPSSQHPPPGSTPLPHHSPSSPSPPPLSSPSPPSSSSPFPPLLLRFIFAENCHDSGFLSDVEWNVYCDWHGFLLTELPLNFDAFIYLQTTPQVNVSPTVCVPLWQCVLWTMVYTLPCL